MYLNVLTYIAGLDHYVMRVRTLVPALGGRSKGPLLSAFDLRLPR